MSELLKSITRQEWKFLLKVLLALLFLTSLSRIIMIISAPSGYVWTGKVYFAPGDRYVYSSYIEQVKNGAYFLQDLYTYKQESVPMLNLFWLGAGLFARLTGTSAKFTLEFLRIFLIPFLVLAFYLLAKVAISDKFQQKIALLLGVFGGGLGVLLYPLMEPFVRGKDIVDHIPIDFIYSESFFFTSAYYSSHFIFSLLLFIIILIFSFLAIKGLRPIKYGIAAGLGGLVLANFHPFTFVVLSFIFPAYLIFMLLRRKGANFLKFYFLFFFLSLPSVLYHLYMLKTPWWQNQTWQSQTEIPSPLFILAGFGLLLLFSVIVLLKNKNIEHENFLIIWFLGQIALIFLPISVQRRFLEGYQILLAILASYFVADYARKRPIFKDKILALFVFSLLFSLSFAAIIYIDISNAFDKNLQIVYIKKEKIEAIQELKILAAPDDMILADLLTSNTIPGIAIRRVFVGHGVESMDFDYRNAVLTKYGKSANEEERQAILKDNKIDWLFYDPGWNWGFDPDKDSNLIKVYQKGEYKIYKTK